MQICPTCPADLPHLLRTGFVSSVRSGCIEFLLHAVYKLAGQRSTGAFVTAVASVNMTLPSVFVSPEAGRKLRILKVQAVIHFSRMHENMCAFLSLYPFCFRLCLGCEIFERPHLSLGQARPAMAAQRTSRGVRHIYPAEN